MSKANKKVINGILLLNKPQGLTSNKALQKIKNLYGAKKAGHTGSLDPLATGMLPLCFGEATKVSHYLLNADKCYEVSALLGVKTNTADATGEVIAHVDKFQISKLYLAETIEQFVGVIKQTPSMFSALKHQGTPLYKYARAGIDVERQAREIHIKELELNDFDGQEFKLTVKCSKGTYIRNLVEDIGDALGVGAHVTELHRTYTAGFDNDKMYDMDDLFDFAENKLQDCLLPMDRAVNYLPGIVVGSNEILALRQGKEVLFASQMNKEKLVRLYDDSGNFFGLGQFASENRLKVQRLLGYDNASLY